MEIETYMDDTGVSEDVNAAGAILLHSCCIGDLDAIHACMSQGYCDIDQTDSRGKTSLHWAVYKGHSNVVQVLIKEYHASIDLPTQDDGSTPLMIATISNNLQMVRTLLSYGAHLQAMNASGASALHLAAGLGYADILHELVTAGAWVELEDGEGESPLFYSVREAHPEIVELLLQAGASPAHPNNDQDTPISLARECASHDSNYNEILSMLNQYSNQPHSSNRNLLEPFTRVESRSFGSSSGNLAGFLTKTI